MPHPYATEAYASSLSHIGRPVAVPEWGCYLLARPIDAGGEDLLGCYPLAVLAPGADLRSGLVRLQSEGFVSITLAIDDIHRASISDLSAAFERLRPFKTHYVHCGGLQNYKPSKQHQYKINRAYRTVLTKPISLKPYLPAWQEMYTGVVERHQMSALHRFSGESFAELAELPGVQAIGGFVDGNLVSCHIWIVNDGHVHSHLVASNEIGYAHRAAYAVNDASVRHFSDSAIVNFGGGAGLGDAEDGLVQFKKGFSNSQRPSYICGTILDHAAYKDLTTKTNGHSEDDSYFPAYRKRT